MYNIFSLNKDNELIMFIYLLRQLEMNLITMRQKQRYDD
jgi:hypothetical protein